MNNKGSFALYMYLPVEKRVDRYNLSVQRLDRTTARAN